MGWGVAWGALELLTLSWKVSNLSAISREQLNQVVVLSRPLVSVGTPNPSSTLADQLCVKGAPPPWMKLHKRSASGFHSTRHLFKLVSECQALNDGVCAHLLEGTGRSASQ